MRYIWYSAQPDISKSPDVTQNALQFQYSKRSLIRLVKDIFCKIGCKIFSDAKKCRGNFKVKNHFFIRFKVRCFTFGEKKCQSYQRAFTVKRRWISNVSSHSWGLDVSHHNSSIFRYLIEIQRQMRSYCIWLFLKVLTKKVVKAWRPIVSENLKKTRKIQKKKEKKYIKFS